MSLSYSLRLVCVIGVSIGLLQILFEVVLWAAAPMLLGLLSTLSARVRERLLYAIQVTPVMLAILFTTCFCVPRYVATETNFASEAVGALCLAIAVAFVLWWTTHVTRGARMFLRTESLVRGYNSPDGIVVTDSATPQLGLIGLLRPTIVISRSLTRGRALDPLALDVVLDHERAHAAQLDNWKLLILRSLPRLNLRLRGAHTWMQLWQQTAEWAADDDAVGGSLSRALALAETLVALARTASGPDGGLACTHLVCRETELAERVERLIAPSAVGPADGRRRAGIAMGLAALSVVTLLVTLASALGDLPERILHLG
jgi:beta-lactamase regulating signal transducer with metallopeptidase domain